MLLGKVTPSSDSTFWSPSSITSWAYSCTNKVVNCWETTLAFIKNSISHSCYLTDKVITYNKSLIDIFLTTILCNSFSVLYADLLSLNLQSYLINAPRSNSDEDFLLSLVQKCSKTRNLWNTISIKEDIKLYFTHQSHNDVIPRLNQIWIDPRMPSANQFFQLVDGLIAFDFKPRHLEVAEKVNRGDLSKVLYLENTLKNEWKKYVAKVDYSFACMKELNWEIDVTFDRDDYHSFPVYKSKQNVNIEHINKVWDEYGKGAYCNKHVTAKECICLKSSYAQSKVPKPFYILL